MTARLQRWITAIWKSERGQDMVEYALIATFISVTILVAIFFTDLPGAFSASATKVGSCLANPATC